MSRYAAHCRNSARASFKSLQRRQIIDQLEGRVLLSNSLFYGRCYTLGGGLAPRGAVVQDLNGDGRLDVVAASDSNISVLIGQSDGTFSASGTYPLNSGGPTQLIGVDLNADGLTDFVTANATSSSVYVLISQGGGAFFPPVSYSAGLGQTGVAAGDFDGDRIIDLAVTSNNTVSILSGNGNGTFKTKISVFTAQYQSSIVADDFNGDGLADFAVSLQSSGFNAAVFLNQGGGDFETATLYDTGGSTQALSIADLNNDGRPDLIATVPNHGVSLLIGQPDGTFVHSGTYQTGATDSVVVRDYDQDGNLDIVSDDTGMTVLYGHGDGTMDRESSIGIGLTMPGNTQTIADLNGDGRPDILKTISPNLVAYYQQSDATFGASKRYAAGTDSIGSIGAGDLTGDGLLDLAMVDFGNKKLLVLPGLGDGTFGSITRYSTVKSTGKMQLRDLNGDGRLDVAAVSNNPVTISVLLQNTNGTLAPAAIYSVPSTLSPFSIADMNQDGRPDFVVAGTNSVYVLFGQVGGTFSTPVNQPMPITPGCLAVADFDGDGRNDLAIAKNINAFTVYVMHGESDGSFTQTNALATVGSTFGIVAADFNNDGLVDIANGSAGNSSLAYFANQGDSVFAPAVIYSEMSGLTLKVADVNGDGLLDISSVVHSHDVSILLNEGGVFAQTSYEADFMANALAFGDFDRNGTLDVATSNTSNTDVNSYVSVLLNIHSAPFAKVINRTLTIDFAGAGGAVSLSQTNGFFALHSAMGDDLVFKTSVADAIMVNGTAEADTINIQSSLSSPLTFNGVAGNDVINVLSGMFVTSRDLGAETPSLTVNVSDGASVRFDASQHLAALHIADGGMASISNGLAGVVITQALSLLGSATFDLNDNDLILDYADGTQLAASQSLINSARSGGTWTGSGITSSAAKDNPDHNTTLGAMEATDYKSISALNTTFDGEPIDNTAVLIKYTYYGDANFNGKVDGGDYARIDFIFGQEQSSGNIGGWINGDFNGDGRVDGSDYALTDFAFSSQGTTLRPIAQPPARIGKNSVRPH